MRLGGVGCEMVRSEGWKMRGCERWGREGWNVGL